MGIRVKRTRNNETWTEARFNSFIRGGLRSLTRKWGPIHSTKNKARVKRGYYKCNGCKKTVTPTLKKGNKRVTNVFVDHIQPVVDPTEGFISWDVFIDRLFCEEDNLQLLCKSCHDKKSKQEQEERKKNDTTG